MRVSMYGSMEQSTPAAAPALGPEEVKFVRKLIETAWDGSGGLIVDIDCCAPCGEGECAPGYTYAGQIAIDEDTISSTYPDFYPDCDYSHCGNTCCVPSDEWDGARAAAGD